MQSPRQRPLRRPRHPKMDPLTILTAFLPALSDGFKSIIHRFTDRGPNPQNVDDAIKLMQATTENAKALAQLDQVGANVDAWVNDVRALQRPVAVVMCIAGFIMFPMSTFWSGLASAAVFYLFGDRTYMYLKGGKS